MQCHEKSHASDPCETATWESHVTEPWGLDNWIYTAVCWCMQSTVRCTSVYHSESSDEVLRTVVRYTAWSGEVLSAVVRVRYYVLLRGTSYNGYTAYSGWAMRTVARYYVEWRGSACNWRGNACEWSYISIKLSRVEKGFRLDILWAYSDGGTKC